MITVRLAAEEDLPGILEIYNDAVLTTTATYDYEPRSLEHRRQWFLERQRDDYPIFVATDGGQRVVGWSALNPYHARFGYRFTAENSVYVAAARNRTAASWPAAHRRAGTRTSGHHRGDRCG